MFKCRNFFCLQLKLTKLFNIINKNRDHVRKLGTCDDWLRGILFRINRKRKWNLLYFFVFLSSHKPAPTFDSQPHGDFHGVVQDQLAGVRSKRKNRYFGRVSFDQTSKKALCYSRFTFTAFNS